MATELAIQIHVPPALVPVSMTPFWPECKLSAPSLYPPTATQDVAVPHETAESEAEPSGKPL